MPNLQSFSCSSGLEYILPAKEIYGPVGEIWISLCPGFSILNAADNNILIK